MEARFLGIPLRAVPSSDASIRGVKGRGLKLQTPVTIMCLLTAWSRSLGESPESLDGRSPNVGKAGSN